MGSAESFDVAIVGAGPAGSAAAIHCAQHGLGVVIVDRMKFPRFRPGETIHPGVVALLDQLGVDVTFLDSCFRYNGIWSNSSGRWEFSELGKDIQSEWQGYQISRAEFDQRLLDRAVQLGCCVRTQQRVRSLLLNNGRITGLKLESNSIKSRYVLDCSGSSHWLTRRLGMKPKIFSPTLMVNYGHTQETRFGQSELPRFEFTNEGWNWTAKVGETTYAWVALDKHRKNFGGDSKRENVTWRCVPKPAGPGFATAGDAAFVLDPSSGQGIIRAIVTGIMAVQLCVKSRQSPSREAFFQQGYSEWIWKFFRKEVRHLKNLRQSHFFTSP